jgi:hypothetical protein
MKRIRIFLLSAVLVFAVTALVQGTESAAAARLRRNRQLYVWLT